MIIEKKIYIYALWREFKKLIYLNNQINKTRRSVTSKTEKTTVQTHGEIDWSWTIVPIIYFFHYCSSRTTAFLLIDNFCTFLSFDLVIRFCSFCFWLFSCSNRSRFLFFNHWGSFLMEVLNGEMNLWIDMIVFFWEKFKNIFSSVVWVLLHSFRV